MLFINHLKLHIKILFIFQISNKMQSNSKTNKKHNIKLRMLIMIIIIKSTLCVDTEWTKIIGGAGDEFCLGIAKDTSSNMYITGHTNSNPFDGQPTNGSYDIFISKFSSIGVKQWTTTIGELGSDNSHAIILDSNSNIYIAGNTSSNPFDGQVTNGLLLVLPAI